MCCGVCVCNETRNLLSWGRSISIVVVHIRQHRNRIIAVLLLQFRKIGFFLGDVKEVRILGGHLGPHCWPKAIDMVAKQQLPLEDIITHMYPLSQYFNAIKMVLQSANSIKVMLTPSNSENKED